MTPEEHRPWTLYRSLEGGSVHTADCDGRFFVIIDESAFAGMLDEGDLADMQLMKVIEFDSYEARAGNLEQRFTAER
ncbi:hypothetical protein [Allohahella marinimesophila]|uniref:Uncharacterized protein n=1 Tax=Allohahella marinimesophila TaxID=1054972 RepID=A0ABP7Q7E8_9GAMM